MFQQLKKLYESELYANVIPIVSERYAAIVADVLGIARYVEKNLMIPFITKRHA